jgi:hypothetical protein
MVAGEMIAFTLESNPKDSGGVIQLRRADSVPDLEHPGVRYQPARREFPLADSTPNIRFPVRARFFHQ